jgi:hypothetical protein
MRLLFLVLLLANIGAFAYIRYAETRADAGAQIPMLQISPEKLKLLKPAATQGRSNGAGVSLACLEWGGFSPDDVARASEALGKLAVGDKVTQRDSAADSYWVYVPPFKTRAEAEKKAGEIKGLGINELYIVQDNDPLRLAVALGAFKSEDAANTYLAQIRQKGVRSAVVAPRGATGSVFVIRDPGDAIAAKIAELKSEFPNAALKATACSEPTIAKK